MSPILTRPVLWVALRPSVPSTHHSDSSLSSSITPLLFHSKLKTFLFCKFFPPQLFFFSSWLTPRIPRTVYRYFWAYKKVKVAHSRLPSVGFRSWSRFLAVSLQVTWVINPAVGCRYIPPGLQLPSQVATLKRAATNFAAWWTEARWVWTVCLRLTRECRGCDLNPGPTAPESSTLTSLSI